MDMRLPELDSLRGIAAAVVVASHALAISPLTSSETALGQVLQIYPIGLASRGHPMVILFFALSGFVLSLPWLRGRPQSYPTFAIRRICRIYVPYLVATILTLLLMSVFSRSRIGDATDWFSKAWSDPLSSSLIFDQMAMLGGYDTPNFATWSLVVEMRISALFPLAMLLVLNYGRRGLLMLLPVTVVTWFLIKLLHLPSMVDLQLKQIPMYGFVFALGAIVAAVSDAIRARGHAWCWLLTGVLLLGIDYLSIPYYPQQLLLGLGAAAILAGTVTNGPWRRLLLMKIPVWLGKISYSLYLVHLPVIVAGVRLLSGTLPSWQSAIASVVAAVFLAEAFHRFVERPAMEMGRFLTSRNASTAQTSRTQMALQTKVETTQSQS